MLKCSWKHLEVQLTIKFNCVHA
uniref:Uncharacterized protein n=1 Tax=Anguilla anguilla TaxID=7936 RepID=A0A0E9VYL5_ANGAN